MNAPTFTSIMEFENTQLKYFIFVTQILILIVSIYHIINTPSEKYLTLVIVLSSSIIILILSLLSKNESHKNKSSIIKLKVKKDIQKNDEAPSGKIPDVLEEGWDLPL